MDEKTIDRITRMEAALDRSIAATAALGRALDLVYDEITDLRGETFRMLTLATEILRDRI